MTGITRAAALRKLGRCPPVPGSTSGGAQGGDGREEPGGPGTRPPGASFLLAAAFKEAPALRWTGGEGGARPPGSARSVAPRSAPLAGAAGARRGCDAAVVFVGSRGRGVGRARRPMELGYAWQAA